MLPTTGSTITPAILSAVLGEGRLQAGDVVVVQHERVLALFRRSRPANSGTASVAAELPAATSRLSTCPW